MPQSNPTLRFIYRNTGTDLYEMYMGEDKYMVFETEPKYEMVSRDYNKINYGSVLAELSNGKQKTLARKLELFESYKINIKSDPWYVEYLSKVFETTKVADPMTWEDCEKMGTHMEEAQAAAIQNIYNKMFSSSKCPFQVEFSNNISANYIDNKETGERHITGYDISMIYKISIKRSMDIVGEVSRWLSSLVEMGYEADRFTEINTYTRTITDKIFYIAERVIETYKYCGDKNFLGQRYYGVEEDKGKEYMECYCADSLIKKIELFYVRCGVSRTGKPLPNRMYKKDSCDYVESPYSYKGTTKNLRRICGDNNVKRYTKMNKVELVKILMKM